MMSGLTNIRNRTSDITPFTHFFTSPLLHCSRSPLLPLHSLEKFVILLLPRFSALCFKYGSQVFVHHHFLLCAGRRLLVFPQGSSEGYAPVRRLSPGIGSSSGVPTGRSRASVFTKYENMDAKVHSHWLGIRHHG